MKSGNDRNPMKRILAVLILAALVFASCGKEGAEDLLIEDQEVYGSSDSASDGGTGEKQDEQSTDSSEESGPEESGSVSSSDDGYIPDDTVDFDPTAMNIANHVFGAYWDNTIFAEDERYIYHADSFMSSGSMLLLLHRIDRESGIDEVVCSDPSCTHSADTCEAFLCRGNITGLQLYGGQIWYCWNTYSSSGEPVDMHVSCFGLTNDCPGGKGRHLYRVIPQTIDQMDVDHWIFRQSFFHRGYLFVACMDRYTRKNVFPENPSVRVFSGINRITAYELEDPADIVFDEVGDEFPFSPDQTFVVSEEAYEGVTEVGFRLNPYEDTLYFCSTFSEPVNPDTPLDSWEYYNHYQLSSWNLEEKRTESVRSDEENIIYDMWPDEDGIRLLTTKNRDEWKLVNIAYGKTEPEELASFTHGEETPLFAAGKIISLQAEGAHEIEGWLYPGKELYYKVYDLNGKPELEIRESIVDPRYKDPSKAPDLVFVLYSVDQENLYMVWEHGLIRVPFSDEDLQFYGVTE